MNARHVPLCVLLLWVAPVDVGPGCGRAARTTQPPPSGPEERRLDAAQFRRGLKERGLTELLDLYIREAPPADPIEALLLERDVLLARYADGALSAPERRDALARANHLLERMIRERPGDLRTFGWRLDLGRSLLYQEAEPLYSSILYRGGTAADRQRLSELMERAGEVFDRLGLALVREQDRLDRIPARTYEQLERSGHVERIETLGPQADYMRYWVRFYRALARGLDDPTRTAGFGALLDDLQRSTLLDTPHHLTHVRAQALLLAGMAGRRVGDPGVAVAYFESARATVRSVTEEAERAELTWVVRLALLETIRAHRDARRFDHAQHALREFDTYLEADDPDNFGLRLVLALAESDVRRSQAKQARADGDHTAAERFENMRFEALGSLARRREAHRDEIYATLYRLMEPGVAPASLHPFEGCALIAGLLNDAAMLEEEIRRARAEGQPASSINIEVLESDRIAALDRAILAAEFFHAGESRVPPELAPEILYNLGVAQLQRGRRLAAARTLLSVARDHADFRRARLAATAAVQVASELADDPSLGDQTAVRDLYVAALETLTERFPHTDDARYWRFFLGQSLHESGRHDQAAEAFARVESDHEHHVYAEYLRVRALATALREYELSDRADLDVLARRRTGVVEAADVFLDTASADLGASVDAVTLRAFRADVELLAAEALQTLGADSSATVLARLEGFEQRYPSESELVGRLLRIRIIAYEHIGRLDEAEQALPEYIRRDPEDAGATLQALFESIRQDIERLRRRGRHDAAGRKAASALVLARQIHQWASGHPARVTTDQQYAIDLQLAQALLHTGHYLEAKEVFAACLDDAPGRTGRATVLRLPAIYGYAETLYQLKEYEPALPRFDRVHRALSPGDRLWFLALLRDLQCRTQLEHPPEGIIQVIRQQKYLHNDLGGPELRRQFEALLRRNQRRVATGPA